LATQGAIPRARDRARGEVSPDGEEHVPVVVEKIAQMAAAEPTLAQSELGGSPAGRW
jgi:hypothetical protein